MKDTTKEPPKINAFVEWWDDLDGGEKFSFVWLSLLLVGLIVLGIIFPIAGLIILGIVVVMITIGVFMYLGENY